MEGNSTRAEGWICHTVNKKLFKLFILIFFLDILPDKDSSCIVKIGETSVIASLKLELAENNKNKKLIDNQGLLDRLSKYGKTFY